MRGAPRLYCGPGLFQSLLKESSVANRDYEVPFWTKNGVFHTIVKGAIQKVPSWLYRREVLELADGGAVALDWLDVENGNETAPLVVMLPGITGSSSESYIKTLATQCQAMGLNVVVFNNRGNGGVDLRTPRAYCASNVEDLVAVIKHVRWLRPTSTMIGCGFSMGGVTLFTYLSKMALTGQDVVLSAAMIVSSPWDPWPDTPDLEKFPWVWMINRHLASNLCAGIQKYRPMFEDKVDLDHVLKSRVISEFDDRFTAPMFGYESLQDYYHDAAMRNRVHDISVPTLCLSAADDFFAPPKSVPFDEIQKSKNVALLMTSHGGHVGFMTNDNLWPNGDSFIEKVFAEFSKIILDQVITADQDITAGE